MKGKIFTIATFFLASITLTSFAPMGAPATSVPATAPASVSLPVSTLSIAPSVTPTATTEISSDVTNPKLDKKAKRMAKILNSKAGKWLMAKMQKGMEMRNARLAKKLEAAEKAGDTKKADKIKSKMNAKAGNLKQLAKFLIIGGLVFMLIAVILGAAGYGYNNGSYGASGFFWGIGTLALVVGLIILLLAYFDVI